MNNEINFEPLGYLKNLPPSLMSHPRCMETDKDWKNLWNTIKDAGYDVEIPKVDFTKRKVIHIRGGLSSSSHIYLVKKINRLADETLEVHCGQVSFGSGLGFAVKGVMNVFVAISRSVTFKEIVATPMEETRLEDFDEELNRLQSEIDFLGFKVFNAERSFREQYGEIFYSKVKDVKHESEIDKIEGLDNEQKKLLEEKIYLDQRYIKARTQHSKQVSLVLEKLAG